MASPTGNTCKQLTLWHKFYLKHFRVNLDFSYLSIPKSKRGFDRLIVIDPNLKPSQIIEVMSKHFRVVVNCGLDKIKTVASRPEGMYAIWVRDRVEADEELKNLSANDLKAQNINGITFEERMIFGFFCWWQNKKHLDINNVTLCSGSRHADGSVPSVYWRPSYGEVSVCWRCPDFRRSGLRAREVVS